MKLTRNGLQNGNGGTDIMGGAWAEMEKEEGEEGERKEQKVMSNDIVAQLK